MDFNGGEMSVSASELWDGWKSSPDIQFLAMACLTKPAAEWREEDDKLYAMFQTDPDQALMVLFAMVQMADSESAKFSIAAGPLEDFLGKHGTHYIDRVHTLALEHRLLREVLDGVWQGSMEKNVWRRVEVLKQSAF